MEFHPDGPQRPDGPIVFNLNTRDEQGNPLRQDYQVMQGAIMRLKLSFRVHNNACIGLKSVTGIKALKQVFKEEEIYGAFRADPHSVVEEYS